MGHQAPSGSFCSSDCWCPSNAFVNRTAQATTDADKFIRQNGVFIPVDLHTMLIDLVTKIRHALIAYDVGTLADDHKMINEGFTKLNSEGADLQKAIEQAVRNRLAEQTLIAEQPVV